MGGALLRQSRVELGEEVFRQVLGDWLQAVRRVAPLDEIDRFADVPEADVLGEEPKVVGVDLLLGSEPRPGPLLWRAERSS